MGNSQGEGMIIMIISSNNKFTNLQSISIISINNNNLTALHFHAYYLICFLQCIPLGNIIILSDYRMSHVFW